MWRDFVRGDVRSQSIGKQLLDFVKQKRKRLELNVYVKIKGQYNFMKGKDFVFKEKEKMRKPEKRILYAMDKINDFI